MTSRYRLTDEPVPHVSTAEFHAGRERARHLEQPAHRPRLERAAQFVREATALMYRQGEHLPSVSDLGCGDGGLLSLITPRGGSYGSDLTYVQAWGYDFAPANAAGWPERGVAAYLLDVFGVDRAKVDLGDVPLLGVRPAGLPGADRAGRVPGAAAGVRRHVPGGPGLATVRGHWKPVVE